MVALDCASVEQKNGDRNKIECEFKREYIRNYYIKH